MGHRSPPQFFSPMLVSHEIVPSAVMPEMTLFASNLCRMGPVCIIKFLLAKGCGRTPNCVLSGEDMGIRDLAMCAWQGAKPL